ncbi:MAG TPA: PqqD family protein [Candidatus Obscuribacterales bacterium]
MHPKRNPDVKTTLLPDGYVVLFSTKTDWAHTLNPTGALVWEFCDGQHSVDELVSAVAGLLAGSDPERLRTEVESLLQELLAAGLVLDEDASPARAEVPGSSDVE